MSVADDIKYNITMSAHTTQDYMDGFADGYARAWQECWDSFIEKIHAERKEREEELAKKATPTPAKDEGKGEV